MQSMYVNAMGNEETNENAMSSSEQCKVRVPSISILGIFLHLEPASNLRTGANKCKKWIQHPRHRGGGYNVKWL